MNFNNYHVTWIHTNPTTMCHIYRENELITAASATCGKCDNFEKRKGRKISFQRALENLFSRPDRKEIYHYLKTTGQMKIIEKSWKPKEHSERT